MDYKSETKKGEVTMRGKYQNPNTSQSNGIPAEFLDEEGNWKMLTWREKAMLTEGQLYAYERFWMSVVDEHILREAAVKKGYNEGWESGMKGGMKEGLAEGDIIIAEGAGLLKEGVEVNADPSPRSPEGESSKGAYSGKSRNTPLKGEQGGGL